jgi:uncharacterized protein YoaH (UPF0181 family)
MFQALRYRKEVEFRYECYLAGVGAADYRNAHRSKDSDKVFSPLDYVTGEDEVDVAVEQAKQNIRAAWGMANGLKAMTKEESAIWRQRRIKFLMDAGHSSEEAVQIVEGAFED